MRSWSIVSVRLIIGTVIKIRSERELSAIYIINTMGESQIQTKIIKQLQSKGVYVWRNNNGGTWDPKMYGGQGGYRASSQSKKGIADILGVLPGGIHLEIEVKSKVGKQSPDQAIHQKRIEALGGVYILARSVKDISHLCV
jgi:hypothetical protein